MLSQGHKVSGPAAVVAVICFFLPWALVSCGGQPVANLSGWQLAAGTTVGSGYSQQQMAGDALVFLVLGAAIVGLVMVYLAYQRGHSTQADNFVLIGAGVVGLFLMFAKSNAIQSSVAQQGGTMELQYGFWGTALGLIGIGIGAIYDLMSASSKT